MIWRVLACLALLALPAAAHAQDRHVAHAVWGVSKSVRELRPGETLQGRFERNGGTVHGDWDVFMFHGKAGQRVKVEVSSGNSVSLGVRPLGFPDSAAQGPNAFASFPHGGLLGDSGYRELLSNRESVQVLPRTGNYLIRVAGDTIGQAYSISLADLGPVDPASEREAFKSAVVKRQYWYFSHRYTEGVNILEFIPGMSSGRGVESFSLQGCELTLNINALGRKTVTIDLARVAWVYHETKKQQDRFEGALAIRLQRPAPGQEDPLRLHWLLFEKPEEAYRAVQSLRALNHLCAPEAYLTHIVAF